MFLKVFLGINEKVIYYFVRTVTLYLLSDCNWYEQLAVLAGDFLLARASMGLSTLRNIEVGKTIKTIVHLV